MSITLFSKEEIENSYTEDCKYELAEYKSLIKKAEVDGDFLDVIMFLCHLRESYIDDICDMYYAKYKMLNECGYDSDGIYDICNKYTRALDSYCKRNIIAVIADWIGR